MKKEQVSRIKKIFIALSVLAFLGLAAGFFSLKKDKIADDKIPDRFYQVKKDDLITGIFLSGNVNSKEKHKLGLEANFKTSLAWIIPENSKIKKGEIIARFDTDELQQKIEELELNYQNLFKEHEIAKEEIAIQKSANAAEIRTAEDTVTDSEEAFIKYRKLEGPKDSDSQDVKVEGARKLYEEAKRDYEDSLKTFNDTVFMKEEDKKNAADKVEELRKKMQTEEINHNNAILDKKIFKRFTNPNKLSQLSNKVEQEKLNLAKTKVKTVSQLVQKENQQSKLDGQIKKNQYDLDKHKLYMSQMQIAAPVDGIITYGDPDNRRGNAQEVKVGMDARRKEVLITIPDMSNLIVEFDIPEQFRSKVKIDDEVIVRPDSQPNVKIKGKISKISPLPVNQIFWDRNSPKIYLSEVELGEQPKSIVSGINVQVEVITSAIKNVLFVPVEAVFDESGKSFVYLKNNRNPEKTEVKIGDSNDYCVQILEGVSEGDTVYLYRPFQK
jgi:RND family efflux transporter MFP subunit